jgi:hypothetical protein
MPKKEIIQVNLAAPNPNLSPATRFGKVVFTPRLPIYASGRRLAAEGVLTMGVKYSLNYLWVILFRKPFSRDYRDIRPPAPPAYRPGPRRHLRWPAQYA